MADSLEAIDFGKYFAFRNVVKHALKLTLLWRYFLKNVHEKEFIIRNAFKYI